MRSQARLCSDYMYSIKSHLQHRHHVRLNRSLCSVNAGLSHSSRGRRLVLHQTHGGSSSFRQCACPQSPGMGEGLYSLYKQPPDWWGRVKVTRAQGGAGHASVLTCSNAKTTPPGRGQGPGRPRHCARVCVCLHYDLCSAPAADWAVLSGFRIW